VIYAIVLADSHAIDFYPGVYFHLLILLARSKDDPRVNSLPAQEPAQHQRLVKAFEVVQTAQRRDSHYPRGCLR